MRIIDKIDKIGKERFKPTHREAGIPEAAAYHIIDIITCQKTGIDPAGKLHSTGAERNVRYRGRRTFNGCEIHGIVRRTGVALRG